MLRAFELRFAVRQLVCLLALASGPLLADTAAEKLASFMEAAEAEGFTGAVIVAQGGEILLEAGYGTLAVDDDRPVRADTVFTTGSVTKQFTAAAIVALEAKGKLSTDDPLSTYFEVPEDKRAITLHHLLTHSSGLPGAIGSDPVRVGRDEMVAEALATPLGFEPGTGYDYSNVGYSLLAAIIEQVTETDYESALHTMLFEPAGMSDTGYHRPGWNPSRFAHGTARDGSDWGSLYDNLFTEGGPGWYLVGNGGILTTVGDMERWHRALMSDDVLPDEAKAKLYGKYVDEGGGTWYGYGWSIEPTAWGELVAHNGGNPYFFADYLRFLDDDVVIFYTTTSRDRRMQDLARKLARIVFTGEVPALGPSRDGAVIGGEAPAASAGSLAAQWGFPGSFRGERCAELVEAVTTDDPAVRARVVTESFAPETIERNGVDRLVEMLTMLGEDLAGYSIRGVMPSGPSGAVVVLEKAGEPTFELGLQLEPEEPHRITSLTVDATD